MGTVPDLIEAISKRGLVRHLVLGFETSSLTWRELSRHLLLALIETIDATSYLRFVTADDLAAVLAAAPRLQKIEGAGAEIRDGDDAKALAEVIGPHFKVVTNDLVRR